MVNAGEDRRDVGQEGNQAVLSATAGTRTASRPRRLGHLLERRPEEVIRRAVKGMLPHNRLGAQQLTKLKIYAGPEHPHQAQRPEPLA